MSEDFLSGKKILITGISGYLGSNLMNELLKHNVHSIRGISRNESKIVEIKEKTNDDRVRFYIGDIRDIHRLKKAIEGIDIVYHCAALKHIDLAQRNIFEAIQTNVIGTQNLIDLSIENNIEHFIGFDTDKSCGGTLNTYGTTKKLMREQIITANFIKGSHKTKFSCMRWGNILNSSGSVVPKWKESIKNNTIYVTEPRMTRFNLSINEVIQFTLSCQENMIGGEIFIPEMRSYNLYEMANIFIKKYGNKNTKIEYINNRGSEKQDEELLDVGEYDRLYKIKNGHVVIPEEKYTEEFGLTYKYNKLPYTDRLYNLKRYSSKDAIKLTEQEIYDRI